MELWLIYAIGAAIGFSIANFGIRLINMNPITLNMISLFIASILIIPFTKMPENKNNIFWAILIGIFLAITTVFNIKAFKTAPNPGFPAAIGGLTTVLMYLYSWVFLGIGLSLVQIIGSLLVLAGVILVAI